MGEVVSRHKIAATHPALAGHFPDRSVVPGVVVLDEVLAALADWLQAPVAVKAFPQVKFLAPLLPDEDFSVRLHGEPPKISFECTAGERVLAKGVVECGRNL